MCGIRDKPMDVNLRMIVNEKAVETTGVIAIFCPDAQYGGGSEVGPSGKLDISPSCLSINSEPYHRNMQQIRRIVK